MKRNNFLEIFVFLIFCFCTIALSFFHEPWFDEMQSIGISKDNIYNILFVIPHFEGHPPLWHLILKLFSNLNAELSLKIPNLLFINLATWLLIFKSPFTKLIKLLLPFTYFLFYQYAIINRPYSLFCFFILLSALFYKERNTKPLIFSLPLIGLCLTGVYGIIIVLGIVLAWIIEDKIKIKSKQSISIFFIVIVSSIIVFSILPNTDAYAIVEIYSKDYIVSALYSFFGLIADATIFDFLNYSNTWFKNIDFKNYISQPTSITEILVLKFWIGCFLGIIINILLFIIFKRHNKLLLFYIPYILFSIFSTFIYLKPHHIGILTIFIIFCFWCISNEYKTIENTKLKTTFKLSIFIFFCIQLFWSLNSYYLEIIKQYSPSRKIVSYIKENHLENTKIFSEWESVEIHYNDNNKLDIKSKNIKKHIDLNFQYIPVIVNQYFNKNIVANFNIDNPDKLYATHIVSSNEKNKILKQKWKELGRPDVLLNNAEISSIFDNSPIYIPVKNIESGFIWKNNYFEERNTIFLRKELYIK